VTASLNNQHTHTHTHSWTVTEADVVITWVLSYIGLEGNELADKLANDGANRPEVDHDIGLEIHEEYSNVERYVEKLWQKEWGDGPTGAFYTCGSNRTFGGPPR
jgi:hypothetical protein